MKWSQLSFLDCQTSRHLSTEFWTSFEPSHYKPSSWKIRENGVSTWIETGSKNTCQECRSQNHNAQKIDVTNIPVAPECVTKDEEIFTLFSLKIALKSLLLLLGSLKWSFMALTLDHLTVGCLFPPFTPTARYHQGSFRPLQWRTGHFQDKSRPTPEQIESSSRPRPQNIYEKCTKTL